MYVCLFLGVEGVTQDFEKSKKRRGGRDWRERENISRAGDAKTALSLSSPYRILVTHNQHLNPLAAESPYRNHIPTTTTDLPSLFQKNSLTSKTLDSFIRQIASSQDLFLLFNEVSCCTHIHSYLMST